jgi:hypothetical protein
MTESGIYDRDNQDFFHVQVYKLQGVMAWNATKYPQAI